MTILSVAGEASGDGLAARVVSVLMRSGIECFGIGGAASEAAGIELVGRLESFTSMGAAEPVRRMGALWRAHRALLRGVRARRPIAAILIGFSEYNARLGLNLRRRGMRVLWCMPPQVWAWRRWRTTALARCADRMAVVLPFEQALWREAGVDARYVGHPALDVVPIDRGETRRALGIPHDALALALLPGSRPEEVRRHGPVMLAAVERLRRQRYASLAVRVLISRSLDANTRSWMMREAEAAGIGVASADAIAGASSLIGAFDAAVVASGTATLEAALAGVPAVVVYRMGRMGFFIARHLVRVPYVALPNLLLGRRAYPELIQRDATSGKVAEALAQVLASPNEYAVAQQQLRDLLAWRTTWDRRGTTCTDRIAAWTMDWLT